MSLDDRPNAANELVEHTARLRVLAEQLLADGSAADLPTPVAQALLTLAVKLYVARRGAVGQIDPFLDDSVTPTDVVVVTNDLLKAANVQLFELTLWNGFGQIEKGAPA